MNLAHVVTPQNILERLNKFLSKWKPQVLPLSNFRFSADNHVTPCLMKELLCV